MYCIRRFTGSIWSNYNNSSSFIHLSFRKQNYNFKGNQGRYHFENQIQMQRLPTDVLLHIFGYLPGIYLFSLSSVSKSFNKLIATENIWEEIMKQLKWHYVMLLHSEKLIIYRPFPEKYRLFVDYAHNYKLSPRLKSQHTHGSSLSFILQKEKCHLSSTQLSKRFSLDNSMQARLRLSLEWQQILFSTKIFQQ